jgi:hypothetical protein
MNAIMTHSRLLSGTGGRHARGAAVAPAAAVAATAAFAGGGLLTQTVIVPHWRSMDPAEFLRRFPRSGPATGATLFPIEVASVALLARTMRTANRQGGRLGWVLAFGCMLGTVALLPAHFARANRAMLATGFPPDDVPAELTTWNRWNWLRTGLALIATAVSTVTLASADHDVARRV